MCTDINLSCRDLKCENILLDQDKIVKVSGMFGVKTVIIEISFTQRLVIFAFISFI